MMDDFKDLTPREKKALEQLSRSQIPPATLEDKVVNNLKNNNLIMKESWLKSRTLKIIGGIAASLLLFLAGYQLGQPAATSGNQYMLLLHEKEGTIPPNQVEIVFEYATWMLGLIAQGHSMTGSELNPGGKWVGTRDYAREEDIISGYFMVEAGSLEEAAKISETSPHLKYGGSIEIREINQN